ncbi:MAG: serine/threonine-protein phosphatase, partial [Myxococcota bacterium]
HGVYIAHIGDSRGYRLRDGQLEHLTEDHSLANEYVRMGILAPEDIEHFPYKNVITRACGLAADVEVEVNYEEIRDGDIYLFCSDGLTDCVNDLSIREMLLAIPDLDDCAEALVDAANDGGGTDNITVLLAKILLA